MQTESGKVIISDPLVSKLLEVLIGVPEFKVVAAVERLRVIVQSYSDDSKDPSPFRHQVGMFNS